LPLTPADLDWLHDKLGEGEIVVTLQASGESSLNETTCPGVWWVTHRNEHGAVTSQFIEVAFVPELVKAHPQDVASGQEYLELMIGDL
jgi:hydrogenase-1 operon protein HyaF